jgi:hypothetical protein
MTVLSGIAPDPTAFRGTDWTVAVVAGDPPPKAASRPATTAPDESWRPTVRLATWTSVPVAVSREYTPWAEVFEEVNPPRTMRCPPGPGRAIARLIGAVSVQGKRPASTAAAFLTPWLERRPLGWEDGEEASATGSARRKPEATTTARAKAKLDLDREALPQGISEGRASGIDVQVAV